MVRAHARIGAAATVAALAVVLVLGASTAVAAHKKSYPDTPKGALADCGAGHYPLKGHYTIKVLQEALKRLSSGTLQYTTCADALLKTIQAQELALRKGTGGGSGHPRGKVTRGAHGTKPTKPTAKPSSVPQGNGTSSVVLPATGDTVTPGTVTVHGASFLSTLPTPLLIVLALLLATVLAVSARAINNIVRTRRTH